MLFPLLCILFLIKNAYCCGCGRDKIYFQDPTRITPVSIVYLEIEYDDDVWKTCTGTLISRRDVLTTASCFFDKNGNKVENSSFVHVGVGSTEKGKLQWRSVIHLNIHPLYESLPKNEKWKYDVAVLEIPTVKRDLINASAACLTGRSRFNTARGALASWMSRKQTVLQFFKVKLDHAGCLGPRKSPCVGLLYAPETKVCMQNSGGPLLLRHRGRLHVIGLVRGMEPGETKFSCAEANKFRSPTRIHLSYKWITDLVNKRKYPQRSCGKVYFRGRIYNGNLPDETRTAFVVRLYNFNRHTKNYSICTGSIISVYHILTAGHCLVNLHKKEVRRPSDITVMYSNIFLPQLRSTKLAIIYVHPRYNFGENEWRRYNFDIGIGQVSIFSAFRGPVPFACLPGMKLGTKPYRVNTYGWGSTSQTHQVLARRLNAIRSELNSEECFKRKFNPKLCHYCTCGITLDGSAICKGDSGSPDVMEIDGLLTVVGIVTRLDVPKDRCHNPHNGFSIHISLDNMLGWITRIIYYDI